MENKNNEQLGFSFTYSAKERAELQKIRDKYTPPTESEDKMARLRRLDASVTQTAQISALIIGIIGALILGFGMSLIMTDFAAFIGFSIQTALVVGIVLGVVGIALVVAAYPVYSEVTKNERKKIAPEIIRITDELMK